MDAMSDAIEGADVMLYGVSLAYKESANVSTISNMSLSDVGSLSLCCSPRLKSDGDIVLRLAVPDVSLTCWPTPTAQLTG